MTTIVSDADVLRTLRIFVAAVGPVLSGLRRRNPFGPSEREFAEEPATSWRGKAAIKIRGAVFPGSAEWESMDLDRRVDWWVRRVGLLSSLLSTAPGVGGAFTERLPIKEALGAAGKVLCYAGSLGSTELKTRTCRWRCLQACYYTEI